MSEILEPILWDNYLRLLDQRKLPNEEVYVDIKTLEDCYGGIKEMVVRGAPCIGFTAIFGVALWLKDKKDFSKEEFDQALNYLKEARPTAVNLEFEVERCRKHVHKNFNAKKVEELFSDIVHMGLKAMQDSFEQNSAMAKFAEKELEKIYGNKKLNLMTHCNTGYLACGTLGTALGVIAHMNQQDKIEKVYADETRPYLQGSRLTAYELWKQNINHAIVCEGAASYLMKNKMIDAIFIGADRIARNGDTANKIGSSTLAIVANHYKVPYFVVAPKSSFDLSLKSGDEIEIELRDPEEILSYKEYKIAPKDSSAVNPSFDVTSREHITAIICEDGVMDPKIDDAIPNLIEK